MCLYALICYMLFKKALDTALARFIYFFIINVTHSTCFVIGKLS